MEGATPEMLDSIAHRVEMAISENGGYRVHIGAIEDLMDDDIRPIRATIAENQLPQVEVERVEELETIKNFYDAVVIWSESFGAIGDLGEFPSGDSSDIDKLRSLGYIHIRRSDSNPGYICWGWNIKAIRDLTILGYENLCDPTEEYS
jgi:hypothetical protein